VTATATNGARFLHSIEQECMTTVAGTDDVARIDRALGQFLTAMAGVAPSLHGGGGLFNGYGRVYVDCGGHLELAAIECDSPYFLARAVEAQHVLVGKALGVLEAEGVPLRLANNNHSGLLNGKTQTWGTHENYLVALHPSQFGERILPFLVTRVFGGAGGLRHPGGEFLAAVRPEFMRQAEGGGTTQNRAIHSTCREEHHMGRSPGGFRYHLILGDGHRSQFNLALHVGATALALRAVEETPDLDRRLAEVGPIQRRGSWPSTLRAFNLLARAGEAPRVHPMVIAVQRVYLQAAREWADRQRGLPGWVPQLLADWERTLAALEAMDLPWLSARLDAFIKYRLWTEVLRDAGRTWHDVPGATDVQSELALLDHGYHSFCDPASPFALLDDRGLLAQRVAPPIVPGREKEPWVPDTSTRARARGRFIAEKAPNRHLVVEWAAAYDVNDGRHWSLSDPFATELVATEARGPRPLPAEIALRRRLAALREAPG